MWHAGIIGSGNIGSAVAARLTALGAHVTMANSRGPESLALHAQKLGIVPGTLEQAAAAPDFVLIAIPEFAVVNLPTALFAATPPDAVVIDAGNYYPGVRDGQIAPIDAGLPDSQWVALTIGRGVVKMFNTMHANRIAEGGLPPGAADRICLPVAGDDPDHKARAIALADAIGFDGLDAGTLAESWRQQPGMPVYCTHVPIDAARAALADARIEDVAQSRDAALQRAREFTRQAREAKGRKVGDWPVA